MGKKATHYPEYFSAEDRAHADHETACFRAVERHVAAAVRAALEIWPDNPSAYEHVRSVLDNYQREHGPAHQPGVPDRPAIPRALVKQVFERDGYRCQECGTWYDLTCDHIIPLSKGGPTELENLRALCRPCNSRKGARL